MSSAAASGHLDIQTTQNLYGWVSEEAEQRTVAQWQTLTAGWRTVSQKVASAALVAGAGRQRPLHPRAQLGDLRAGAAGAATDGVLVAHAARPPGVSLAAGGPGDVARV